MGVGRILLDLSLRNIAGEGAEKTKLSKSGRGTRV